MNNTNANTNSQQQSAGTQPQNGKDKQWLEQLAGTVPDDKEEKNKWWKFFTHPLTIIIGAIILGYRWSSKQEARYKLLQTENEGLKAEITRLKKKCKKLKKKNETKSTQSDKPNRLAVLD